MMIEDDSIQLSLYGQGDLEEYIKSAKGIWARIVYNEYLKNIK